MDVGVIGSGNIGGVCARGWARAGHRVAIANSRGPESLRDFAAEGDVRPSTVEDAAAFGEVVLVAIPLVATFDLPVAPFAGRVVVDAGNYHPSRDGQLARLDDGSSTSSELVAEHLEGARVVKALNSMRSTDLEALGRPDGHVERLALPMAGDDEDAKRLVDRLLEALGFDAVDAGPLAAGRRFGPGTPLYGQLLGAHGVRAELRV